MDVRKQYNENKPLFIAAVLIGLGFILTGTILVVCWYKKKQAGKMKANGIQKSTEDFITGFEGRTNTVYNDNGKLAVGIGHDLDGSEGLNLGDTVSDAEIDDWFRRDTRNAANEVDNHISVPLSQNQYDALIDLNFNIGAGAFDGSTLKNYINAGETPGNITAAWIAWDHERTNGMMVESPELKARRQKEIDLYFS